MRKVNLFWTGLLIFSATVVSVGGRQSASSDKYLQSFLAEGEMYFKQGDFKKAEAAFQNGLEWAGQLKNTRAAFTCFMRLGAIQWNQGEIQTSAEIYSKALALTNTPSFAAERARCLEILKIYPLYEMGKTYRLKGETKKSISSFNRAVTLAQAIASPEHELKCIRQLSVSYWDQNEIGSFLKLSQKALGLANDLNHKREEGKCLNHIGLYYWKTADYPKALSCYRKALSIAQLREDGEEISNCLNNVGLIYKEIGLHEQALDSMQKALDVDRKAGADRFVSIDLNNMGDIYMRRHSETGNNGDLFQALSCYRECLDLSQNAGDQRTEVRVLSNIGQVYLDLFDYDQAWKHLKKAQERALENSDQAALGMILNNLGMVRFSEKNYPAAETLFKQALTRGVLTQNHGLKWEALWHLGKCMEKMNRFRDAVSMYNQAVDVIDDIRGRIGGDSYQSGYMQHRVKVYGSLIDLIFRMYRKNPVQWRAEQIFHFVERAKARAFLDLVAVSKIGLSRQGDEILQEKETALSLRISSLMKKLYMSGLTGERRAEIKNRLKEAEAEYMEWLSLAKTGISKTGLEALPVLSSPEDLPSNLLGKRTAIFEFYLGETHSYLFVLAKEKFRIFSLPGRKAIRKSLKAYLKMISGPPSGRFQGRPAARRLFQELLFPLDDKNLSDIDTLIIIPDGILYGLPFETLVMNSDRTPEEGNMLVEKYKIFYAHSASSLNYLLKTVPGKKKKETKDLLAFGSPKYPLFSEREHEEGREASDILKKIYVSEGYDFSPLKYGAREARTIGRYFPAAKKTILIGDAADETVIKNTKPGEYKILHFACHGFFDERFPLRSALVLSLRNAGEEDGFLQAREIYNLNLASELVVLSGCQTGRGRIARGEGIIGLPRIFFFAGARAVVSAVWEIADKPSVKFMDHFYRYLTRGEDKAQALKLAKLDMIHSRYSHPFFWAAFVLYGDISPID